MTARILRAGCERTGKTRYRNRKAVIAGIDKHRQRFRRYHGRDAPPLYHYRCHHCRGWHMTHIDPEEYQQQRKSA